MIGFREILEENAKEFVSFVQNTGINSCLLTGDSEEATLNLAYHLNLVPHSKDIGEIIIQKEKPQVFHIKEDQKEDINAKI